jgi:hypothetical protein
LFFALQEVKWRVASLTSRPLVWARQLVAEFGQKWILIGVGFFLVCIWPK